MNCEEKTLIRNTVYSGKIINLRKDTALLPNGDNAIREVVEHPGGVCVVPLTDDGDIILVEQFRYPYMELTLEIPAGKRDRNGEEPLECGRRELSEETGASSDKFIPLGTLYPSPGYCDEVIYMFAAVGLSFGDTNPDEDEFLNVRKISLQTAVDMIMAGEIKDAKTQAAVLKVNLLRSKGEL